MILKMTEESEDLLLDEIARLRYYGPAVKTHGVETEVYRKEDGGWHLVHVHYSEDRQPAP